MLTTNMMMPSPSMSEVATTQVLPAGLGIQAQRQASLGSSGGAMGGIMDSVQTGFDQLDSAMQGAFDTIKQSLSSSYTPQEVLVPNEGGGGQQPSFPGGGGGFPFMPSPNMQPQPFIDRPGGEIIGSATDNMGYLGLLELQTGEAQPRLPDIMYAADTPSRGPTPALSGPFTNFGPAGPMGNQFNQQMQILAQGNPTGGIGNAQMGVTNLNQDNNIGGASAQQQIDQMISGNAGQYNG
tara:strand:+ start:4216 stop:4929 length:714 start_codon:yes stop_codon:yes gene_type:complete